MNVFREAILFPAQGKVDKDSDPRYIQRGDIIDALNCRWGARNDGTVNAVENLVGNKLLNISLPDGNNTIMGGCTFFEEDSLIIFLYNDKGNHCILQVSRELQEVYPILWEERVLNFDNKFINRPVVIGGILYWTDNNGLRNLYIEKAKKMTYKTHNEGIGFWIIELDFVVT